MQYVFFWVIPWRLSSKSRRFGILYRFHLQGQVDDLPLKMEPIEGFETSAFRTHDAGELPKRKHTTKIENFFDFTGQTVVMKQHFL